ncbi:SH3 domain-containing protein [Leptospira congkakensis]|uniref:SH3 domain-containing protein n=1 Tax=Leptospira congkakensis TaxID=2484932 RepID=A0A4Z1A255_9LEPT|nr:SH3 domain-containing protein [Leptospira congkakensis]TGL87598.1 SH3 domain-containing protein [Leptospira congkakensis]TGL89787.1 SH3 domain-containing protein [Leptospira congkakensis]TGL95748.1 SH3 domain-containing protein [Leptospira congkakensis]
MSGYKILLYILILSCVLPIFPEDHWDNYIQEKTVGSTYQIFGDNVNIRESNNLNAKIKKKLSIGSVVTILSKTNQILEQDSVKEYWYEVKSEKDTGFIWGGLIADYSFPIEENTILCRNLGVKLRKIELKLIQGDKILTQTKLDVGPVSNEIWKHNIYSESQFSPSPKFLFGLTYFVFSEIEYGYTNELLISISPDNKLISQFSWIPGSCDPPSCAESWLVFPNETLSEDKKTQRKLTKGIKNTIQELTHSFDIEDSNFHEYYKSEYIWNGTTFQKKETQ